MNEEKKKVEMIEITVEFYDRLYADSDFLDCLRAAGVDNWEGYDIAQDMLENNYSNE